MLMRGKRRRGPFTHSRVIDVTRAAAEELAFLDSGVARVASRRSRRTQKMRRARRKRNARERPLT